MSMPSTDQPSPAPPFPPERDPLTGLPGMAAARRRLARWEGERDTGEGGHVHALLLGLRRFEAVNLAYGEETGDEALIAIARRVAAHASAVLDGPCLTARGPGGTFLVIAEEACSRERWQMFAEQLADLVARPIARRGGALRLSPRVALLRVLAGESAESAIDRLAQTLAAVLRQPARRVMWADGETTRPGRTAAQLQADLLHAIDAGQIEVLFQPQFALGPKGAEHLSGAEALARWNHPTLGRIGAGALFAIAEQVDHVAPLSRHIAETALAEAAIWPAAMRLSLNVTAADLAAGSFAQGFAQMLQASGFAADRLTLEVTEQVLVDELLLAQRSLSALAGQGVRIALDDFGAGFCNFLYLKLLPLHYLKLDRTMVDGISEDPRDLAVLRGIVAMARALDLAVIAEGIESEAQRRVVAQEGCAYYQGFLRAKPMPAGAFVDLARAVAARLGAPKGD